MLVCNVSMRAPRRAIAAELAEIAAAADTLGTGNIVFATLVDDPASVGDFVDAFTGEIMLEAASAADAVDGNVPATYAVDVTEAASAADVLDGSSAITYTTFTSASTNVTLSNGNLTVRHADTAANTGARSTSYQNASGKFYFEMKVDATHGNLDGIGLTTAAGTYANMTSGGVSGGIVYFPGIDNTYSNGSGVSLGLGVVAGDTVCIAFDSNNHTCWFRKNGGNWNGNASYNPATNTGGFSVAGTAVAPAICYGGSGLAINDGFTANYGQSAFTYTVPSGFGGWPA